jgi:hypothetical protein
MVSSSLVVSACLSVQPVREQCAFCEAKESQGAFDIGYTNMSKTEGEWYAHTVQSACSVIPRHKYRCVILLNLRFALIFRVGRGQL